jgi:hypothetical protein
MVVAHRLADFIGQRCPGFKDRHNLLCPLQLSLPAIMRDHAGQDVRASSQPLLDDNASAADLKFLHHLPDARLRNFKSKSGTRINMFGSASLFPKFA